MDKKRLMKALGKAEDAEMEDEDLMLELEAACAGYMKGKDMEAGMAKKVEEITASKAVVDSEVASLKTELEAARAEIGKVREAAADGFVAELVASGKIPPKAAGIHKLYRTQYLTDSAAALEAAKELTTAHAPDGKRITDDATPSANDSLPLADRIEKRAQELQASKSLPRETAYAEATRELLK
jgi:hypothetical protein